MTPEGVVFTGVEFPLCVGILIKEQLSYRKRKSQVNAIASKSQIVGSSNYDADGCLNGCNGKLL